MSADFSKMNISYKKDVKTYQDFVENPDDRKKRRAFTREYNDICEAAVKLHERLLFYETAEDYNKVFGKTDNGIEKKQGCKNKDCLILKTRVSGSVRKFFYHENEDSNFVKVEEWDGNFANVTHIYVIAVTPHDYNVK